MPTETRDFWKLFKSKSCSIGLQATDRTGVFEELVDNLIHGDALDAELRDAALKALDEREALASTGVGMNVAIPHVKLPGLEAAAVGLAVHKEGVDWSATDGDPVHLFFTVLRPEAAGDQHDPDRHLEMMRWIARLARDGDFRRFAVNATTKKELVDLLKEKADI